MIESEKQCGCFAKNLKNDFLKYLNDKIYMLCLLITAIGSYGFLITHNSVSVDDLEYDRYYFGELIAQGRLSSTAFCRLFDLTDNFIWIQDFWGMILLCLGTILLCIALNRVTLRNSRSADIIFTCLFVSYPLHSELFSYNGCFLAVGIGMVFVSLSLLCMIHFFNTGKFRFTVFSALLILPPASWYESVIIIYIAAVFGILLIEQSDDKNNELGTKKVILKGFTYACPLAVAMIVEAAVSNLVRILLKIEPSENGQNQIGWFSLLSSLKGGAQPQSQSMMQSPLLIKNTLAVQSAPIINSAPAMPDSSLIGKIGYSIGIYFSGFVKSIINYLPVKIFVAVIFILLCITLYKAIKLKKFGIFLCGAGLIFSNFIISFVTCNSVQYRTCTSFAFCVAFVPFFILCCFNSSDRKKSVAFSRAAALLCAVLVFVQINSINYYFTNDYLRFEHEKKVLSDLGDELVANYDLSKNVVFTGVTTMPDNLRNRIEKDYNNTLYKTLMQIPLVKSYIRFIIPNPDFKEPVQQTNSQNYINWAITITPNQESLIKFFRYLGYDKVKNGTKEQIESAEEFSKDLPSWPQDGSIKDNGEYIIVNF